MISFQEKKLEEKYLDQASFFIAASDKIIADNVKIFPKTKGFLHENGIDLELLNKLKLEKIKEELLDESLYQGEKTAHLSELLQAQGKLKGELKEAENKWFEIQEKLEDV